MSDTKGLRGVWDAAVSFANRRAGTILGIGFVAGFVVAHQQGRRCDAAVGDHFTSILMKKAPVHEDFASLVDIQETLDEQSRDWRALAPMIALGTGLVSLYPVLTLDGQSPWVLALIGGVAAGLGLLGEMFRPLPPPCRRPVPEEE